MASHLKVDGFGGCRSLAFAKDDKIIAGIVYHNYTPRNIEASIVSIDKAWQTKENIKLLYKYPFKQLGVHRITVLVREGNQRAHSLAKKMGFTEEGRVREFYEGEDMIVYGMLKRECGWL